MLLGLAGVASASPRQPRKFRIKGYTTSIDLDFSVYPFVAGLVSEGKVIRHIQGTFEMDEDLFFVVDESGNFIPLESSGWLTITTKKGDDVLIWFEGGPDPDGETISGDFWVDYGTGFYAELNGGGTYNGIPDDCDPVTLECPGFYVDFTFTYWDD